MARHRRSCVCISRTCSVKCGLRPRLFICGTGASQRLVLLAGGTGRLKPPVAPGTPKLLHQKKLYRHDFIIRNNMPEYKYLQLKLFSSACSAGDRLCNETKKPRGSAAFLFFFLSDWIASGVHLR